MSLHKPIHLVNLCERIPSQSCWYGSHRISIYEIFMGTPALYLIISLIQQGFDVPLGNLALHWKNPIQWSFKSIVILWWVMAFMVQKTSQYICERVLRWSAWIRSSLDFSMFPCWRSGILDLRGPRGAAKNHDLEPPFSIGMYVPKWWTIDGKWKSAWAAPQNLKKTREIIAISYLIFRKSASLFAWICFYLCKWANDQQEMLWQILVTTIFGLTDAWWQCDGLGARQC